MNNNYESNNKENIELNELTDAEISEVDGGRRDKAAERRSADKLAATEELRKTGIHPGCGGKIINHENINANWYKCEKCLEEHEHLGDFLSINALRTRHKLFRRI